MISAVSSNSQVQAVTASTPKAPPAPVAKPVEDSVHLSPQAQAAAKGSGDLDHDGDSH